MHYIALFLSAILFPSIAMAIFDVQVFGGSGMGSAEFLGSDAEMEKIQFQGSDLGVSMHLNPIEALPVSIGASYLQEDPKITGSGRTSFGSLSGQQISVELMAWLPLNGYAVYGKIGEIVQGSYRAIRNKTDADLGSESPISEMSYQGRYVGIGAGASMTAGVGVFCELRGKFGGKLLEFQRSLFSSGNHSSRAQTVGSVSATSLFAGVELGI
jgi:hypothetical protein